MQNHSHLRDHPVFICGHPKSGTTLLRALLDSHPQLVVYPDETFFFRGLLPEIKGLSFAEKLNLSQRYLIHYFHTQAQFPGGNQSQPFDQAMYQIYAQTCLAMERFLPQTAFRHDGDLLSAAVLAFGEVNKILDGDKKYWVEKTPYNEHFSGKIYQWWPEAQWIHVVRDPRDNFVTYQRKHPGLKVEDFTASWNASFRAGLQSQNKFGEHAYLIIRYEDLTQQPDNAINKIIDFLQIKDDELLRKPTKNGVLWEGNSMFNDRFSGISAKPLGRWKSELKNQDLSIIEFACRSNMKRLNYISQGRIEAKSLIRLFTWNLKQTMKLPAEMRKVIKKTYGTIP